MKKDRESGGFPECTKEHALEESVSWAFRVDCPGVCLLGRLQGLGGEREEGKPDLPGPEWGEGHWLRSIFLRPCWFSQHRTDQHRRSACREGVPGKAEPAVDGD